MRTVYGPNPVPTSSSDVEIDVDVSEAEEVTFTLVINKKSKKKAKTSSLSPANSRNKILLVSRALSAFKAATARVASKLAVTHPLSAVAATITSKSAQSQNVPPLVLLAFKPKPKAKSFAQVTKVNISSPKFAPTLSHEDFLHLL